MWPWRKKPQITRAEIDHLHDMVSRLLAVGHQHAGAINFMLQQMGYQAPEQDDQPTKHQIN